jgi:hypothetical protein
MKFVLAAERQERRDRLRRDRAAASALRIAFPAIEQLRFEFTFQSASTSTPASQSHILHPAAAAFFEFACPYANCDGQFDLTGAVNTALTDTAHQAKGVLECHGVRARDGGSNQPCELRLVYSVTAIYQPDI